VRDLVYGAIFTRGPEDLKNSAVFIGGSDVATGEEMLAEVQEAFLGPLKVSVMLDANGCNTTATAAVAKILSAAELAGEKIVVLAGTGPVGIRAAALFAQEGASVTLTSRSQERADEAAASIQERFGVQVTGAEAADEEGTRDVLEGAKAVLCAGAAGIQLLPESIWVEHPTLRVLGDVNAVPPLGIEGIKVHWKGKEKHDKAIFGAIGIGDFKMKIHHASVARLFEQNDLVLDAEEVYATAKEIGG
jgi:threonine dehydrogenase-like Zn-dependent dehydrogenase